MFCIKSNFKTSKIVTVSKNSNAIRTAVPAKIRDSLELHPGDTLLWKKFEDDTGNIKINIEKLM